MLPQLKRISGIECWVVRVHPEDHYDVVILNAIGEPPTVWQGVPGDIFDVPELEVEETSTKSRQPRKKAAVTSNQERQIAACRCEYWKS